MPFYPSFCKAGPSQPDDRSIAFHFFFALPQAAQNVFSFYVQLDLLVIHSLARVQLCLQATSQSSKCLSLSLSPSYLVPLCLSFCLFLPHDVMCITISSSSCCFLKLTYQPMAYIHRIMPMYFLRQFIGFLGIFISLSLGVGRDHLHAALLSPLFPPSFPTTTTTTHTLCTQALNLDHLSQGPVPGSLTSSPQSGSGSDLQELNRQSSNLTIPILHNLIINHHPIYQLIFIYTYSFPALLFLPCLCL